MPSFFVIGPVAEIAGNIDTITKVYPSGVDESYSWPPIGEIKLKQSTVVEDFSTKTSVFLGGRLSRRTPDAFLRRNESAAVRAERNGLSPITRGNQWDMSKQSQGRGKGKGDRKY